MAKPETKFSRDGVLRLAIIGGGAGAREFIIQFLEAGAYMWPVSIDVFEPRKALGRGIAWSDEKTPVLANMRVETLGPNYGEWDLIQSLLRDLQNKEADQEYPSRSAVGAALDERYERKIRTKPEHWNVKHVVKQVIDIEWDGDSATVVTEDDVPYPGYGFVLLSLGNLSTRPPSGLEGNPRFINGWNVSAIEQIEPDSDVFIQGSGLTAIDATMRLLECGHKICNGSIVWQSITGTLPFVRPRQMKLNPKYLRLDTLEALVRSAEEKYIPIRLETLWRLFRYELESQAKINEGQFAPGTDYAGFIAMYDELSDPAKGRELIDYGIKGSTAFCLWFSVAKLFDEYVIPFVWNALPDDEKAVFLRERRRDFDRFWAPIPVNNGRRIQGWLTDGTIQLVRTKVELQADSTTGKIIFDPTLEDPLGEKSRADLRARYKDGFDWAIDAKGIQAELENLESTLVANLLNRETLIPYRLNAQSRTLGAKVEWFTGAVLGADERPHGWLYTLTGSLTAGAHRFTNSYMAASVSAERVAIDLFQRLA
jgi:FAD-NAD(P)-binding